MPDGERPLVILRLGNSDDVQPHIAEPDRAHNVAGGMLQASIRRQVTTVARAVWPNPDLPDRVGDWVDRYQPEIVFLKVNWYWYGFESIPLRLKRQFGRPGERLAGAGRAMQAKPRIAHTRAFKASKRVLQRVVRGDSPFTPEQVCDVMETTIRRILTREDVCLIVKGTGYGRDDTGVLGPYWSRFSSRRDVVHGRIQPFCHRLGVPYYTVTPPSKADAGLDDGDGVHKDPVGQYHMGAGEGRMLVEAWERHTRA